MEDKIISFYKSNTDFVDTYGGVEGNVKNNPVKNTRKSFLGSLQDSTPLHHRGEVGAIAAS
jgi:hypothetical protein